MSIESLSPGPEISASNLLEEAKLYYDEGGIIPKDLRKEYYVALYDTRNNLMGRFIGQYMGMMENELTTSKFQALLLKTNQIIDFKKYANKEDNTVITLLFTNIRNAGKIGTGIRAFKPIDYEEGEFNNGVEENFYRERSILNNKVGVEFPLAFSQQHMNFYEYKTGKQTINRGMADIVSSIISTKTGKNVRGIVDPNILNGGKTKRHFRKKRKCLTKKYKRKGVKKIKTRLKNGILNENVKNINLILHPNIHILLLLIPTLHHHHINHYLHHRLAVQSRVSD